MSRRLITLALAISVTVFAFASPAVAQIDPYQGTAGDEQEGLPEEGGILPDNESGGGGAPGDETTSGLPDPDGGAPAGDDGTLGARAASLPFTGFELMLIVALGAGLLGTGLAIRRALPASHSQGS